MRREDPNTRGSEEPRSSGGAYGRISLRAPTRPGAKKAKEEDLP
jgi:hypothetical protein